MVPHFPKGPQSLLIADVPGVQHRQRTVYHMITGTWAENYQVGCCDKYESQGVPNTYKLCISGTFLWAFSKSERQISDFPLYQETPLNGRKSPDNPVWEEVFPVQPKPDITHCSVPLSSIVAQKLSETQTWATLLHWLTCSVTMTSRCIALYYFGSHHAPSWLQMWM